MHVLEQVDAGKSLLPVCSGYYQESVTQQNIFVAKESLLVKKLGVLGRCIAFDMAALTGKCYR